MNHNIDKFERGICCPWHGHTDEIIFITDWEAFPEGEPVNIYIINEYQCHHEICAGKSFWA